MIVIVFIFVSPIYLQSSRHIIFFVYIVCSHAPGPIAELSQISSIHLVWPCVCNSSSKSNIKVREKLQIYPSVGRVYRYKYTERWILRESDNVHVQFIPRISGDKWFYSRLMEWDGDNIIIETGEIPWKIAQSYLPGMLIYTFAFF